MRCSTSLQGCSPAFCCDRPVAPGTSAANGVSSLLCAPGDISILRRHSYHIDYGARAGAYVDAFMDVIRWDNPGKLYDRYSREG